MGLDSIYRVLSLDNPDEIYKFLFISPAAIPFRWSEGGARYANKTKLTGKQGHDWRNNGYQGNIAAKMRIMVQVQQAQLAYSRRRPNLQRTVLDR